MMTCWRGKLPQSIRRPFSYCHLLIEAALLVVPPIVAPFSIKKMQKQSIYKVSGTMGIPLLGMLGTLFKPKNHHIAPKKGMLIVAPVGCSGPFLEDVFVFLLVRSP